MKRGEKSQQELNKIEISYMPDRGFRVIVIQILTRLETRAEVLSGTLNKDTENKQTKKQSMTKKLSNIFKIQ